MSENAETSSEGREEALMRQLRFSGIKTEELRELVGAAVRLQRGVFWPIRIFPRGIPPVTDGLTLQALVPALHLPSVVERLSAAEVSAAVRSIAIFPYGVPVVETFQVDVAIGAA